MLGWNCKKCSKLISESDYHYINAENVYCYECAFLDDLINEKQYLKSVGICLSNVHATIKDGKVLVWHGKKPPWEKSDSEMRNTIQYRDWRNAVFERDNYTCQSCGVRGGYLEAHHILSYKKYKEQRFNACNGMTYCKPCHRNIHKRSD